MDFLRFRMRHDHLADRDIQAQKARKMLKVRQSFDPSLFPCRFQHQHLLGRDLFGQKICAMRTDKHLTIFLRFSLCLVKKCSQLFHNFRMQREFGFFQQQH